MLMLGETERRERFAYALQRALQARAMSERQLAMKLKVDPRTVAKWRRGRSLPDLYQTLALAEILKVDEGLFRDPPAVPPPPPEPYYPIAEYLLGAIAKGAARGLTDELPADEGDDGHDERPSQRRPQGRSGSPR